MKLLMLVVAAMATSFAFGQKVVYGPPVLDPSSQEGQTQQYQQQSQPFRQQQKQQQQQRQQRLTVKKNMAQAAEIYVRRILPIVNKDASYQQEGEDNRCIRYILDKNGCSYEDLPSWIFHPETRSSKNFPPVCTEEDNSQVSSIQSTAEAQQAPSSQSRRYYRSQITSSQSKGQSGLQFSEAQLRQLASSLDSKIGAAYSSGSYIARSQTSEPWSYAYKMMYSQVPLFLVYAIQPYELSQGQYKTKGLTKGLVAAKEGTADGLLGNEELAVINEGGVKKISAPFLTWYSSKKGTQEQQGQAKRRVTRNGGWHVTEQTAVQSQQPFGALSAGQDSVQAQVNSAQLTKLATGLSEAVSAALSEEAEQQTSNQQSSAARDSSSSSRGFYRESSHEFSQLAASDSSAEQQQEQEHSSQEEAAAQAADAAEAQQMLQEAPSASAQSNVFADQASGQQTGSWSTGIRRQKFVQAGGTKGGTKGQLRAWTRNNLGYSG